MQIKTKPRASTSTLPHVEERHPRCDERTLSALVDTIDTQLRKFGPAPERVLVKVDDTQGLLVDNGGVRLAAPEETADVCFYVHPHEFRRLAIDDLEPRQATLFGQIKMFAGEARRAVAFFDHLVGRVVPAAAPFDRPLPTPTTDWAQARLDLHEFGYALVKDILSPEELAGLRARVVEQAAGELEAGCAVLGESTHRIWNLINKGRVFHDLLLHPVFDYFIPDYVGEHAIMPSFSANIALPGNASSIMHYDQIMVHHKMEFATALNSLWFLDDVSDANGGTRLIPGSHKNGVMPADPFDVSGTVAAEGPAGTVLFLDSRVWHSVGHNSTNDPRHVLVLNFTRSYIRSQENYFLSLLPEVEAGLDERVRVMLGFRCTGSLGAVQGPIEGQMNGRIADPIGELQPRAPVDH